MVRVIKWTLLWLHLIDNQCTFIQCISTSLSYIAGLKRLKAFQVGSAGSVGISLYICSWGWTNLFGLEWFLFSDFVIHFTVWTYNVDVDFFNFLRTPVHPCFTWNLIKRYLRPSVCPMAGSNWRWFRLNNSYELCCMHSFMAVRWRCCRACVNQELQHPVIKSLTRCWIQRFPGSENAVSASSGRSIRPLKKTHKHTHTHMLLHGKSRVQCYHTIISVQRCSFVGCSTHDMSLFIWISGSYQILWWGMGCSGTFVEMWTQGGQVLCFHPDQEFRGFKW